MTRFLPRARFDTHRYQRLIPHANRRHGCAQAQYPAPSPLRHLGFILLIATGLLLWIHGCHTGGHDDDLGLSPGSHFGKPRPTAKSACNCGAHQ